MARVVVDDLDARILLEVVVLRPEELGHDFGDERLDLAQHDPLDAGIEDGCRSPP